MVFILFGVEGLKLKDSSLGGRNPTSQQLVLATARSLPVMTCAVPARPNSVTNTAPVHAPTAAAADAPGQKAKATAVGFAHVKELKCRGVVGKAALYVNAAPIGLWMGVLGIFCEVRFGTSRPRRRCRPAKADICHQIAIPVPEL